MIIISRSSPSSKYFELIETNNNKNHDYSLITLINGKMMFFQSWKNILNFVVVLLFCCFIRLKDSRLIFLTNSFCCCCCFNQSRFALYDDEKSFIHSTPSSSSIFLFGKFFVFQWKKFFDKISYFTGIFAHHTHTRSGGFRKKNFRIKKNQGFFEIFSFVWILKTQCVWIWWRNHLINEKISNQKSNDKLNFWIKD